jgi:hypothetical protein
LLLHSCLKDHFSLLFLYYWCFFSQQRRMASLRIPKPTPRYSLLHYTHFLGANPLQNVELRLPFSLPPPGPTATLDKPRRYGGFLTYAFLIGWFWWGKDKNILEAWFLQGVEGEEGWYFERKRRPTRMDVSEQFSLASTRVPHLTWALAYALFVCDNTRPYSCFSVDSNWGARSEVRFTVPLLFRETKILITDLETINPDQCFCNSF